MRDIYSYLRGSCQFTAEGNFPERFLNLSARADMGLWDIKRNDSNITARIIASKYKRLLPIARKCGIKLKIKNKYGLPFRLLPYRYRAGMPLGFLLFCGIIWILSQFVWFVDIPQVSPGLQQRLENAVYEAGVRPGVLRSRIDTSMITTELQLGLRELSWAGITTNGSYISIDVREMEKIIKETDNSVPCNIIASKDGIITSINSSEGENTAMVGQTVQQGDLLISGVMEYSDGTVNMVHAAGEVIAKTYYEFTAEIPYLQHKPERTGRVVTIRRLMILGIEIPLHVGSEPKGNFERECDEWQLCAGETELPLIVRTERWYELKNVNREISATEAEAEAYNQIKNQIDSLGKIEIITQEESIYHTDNGVVLSCIVTAKENIAAEELILFE